MNIRPTDAGGTCPVCGATLIPGAQFCGACGSHVPSPLNPYDAPTSPDGVPSDTEPPTVPGISGPSIETGVRCFSCGTSNLPTAERCIHCGSSLLDADTSIWPTQPGHNGNHS